MALIQTADPAQDAQGRRRVEVFDPATLERTAELEFVSTADVEHAVERARKAQTAWGELSFAERARPVLRLRDRIAERSEEVVSILCSDTGKPRIEGLSAEVLPSCDALTWYARHAAKLLAPERRRLHLLRTKRLFVQYRPMGVVGLITPWNFPLVLSLNPLVQALMAGNAVVLKPSEITPRVGRLIGELCEEAQFPDDVVQVLVGDGTAGAALVEAGCDKISFTGSVRTGRAVAEACGRQLVPCTLELGGKDPMIVCADADLERAAHGAVWGAFANSGQVCLSTERVYVVEEVADAFIDRVVQLTRELRQGPEREGEIDVGAMISPAQLEIIEAHVADARAHGARVLTGGRRNPQWEGYFFEPTVLVDVNHDMRIMREETFGPCLPIQVVADEEEALQLANDTGYGLQASVWTRDSFKARRLARRIDAGGVVVDDVMATYAATESPFGGVKNSGIGRVNGELGLRSYCHVQTVLTPRLRMKREPLWYPYSAAGEKRMQRVLKLLYRSPLGRLLGG